MEEGMMMEEAPSIAVMVGGSAKMGIKNVSTDGSPASDGLSLIREYEVTFDSSGTTDGGLVFGASISFDEGSSGLSAPVDAMTDASNPTPNTSPSTPFTNAFVARQNIWVLESDGDAAVTTVNHDNDDGTTPAVDITPEIAESYNDIAADGQKLRRIEITWNATGDGSVVATATEPAGFDLDGDGTGEEENITIAVANVTRETVDVSVPSTDTDTDTDTNTHVTRNGIGNASVYVGSADGSWKLKFGTGLDAGIYKIGDIGVAGEGDSFYATNSHTVELSGSVGGAEYAITTNSGAEGDPANEWSAGVKYNVGTVSVGVGMDSEKGLGLSAGTDVSGVSMNMIYTKAEMGEGDMMMENTAMGVSVGIAAGEDATVTLKYSTNKTEGAVMDEKKLIEADFAYDLGGGAKFNAGVDSLDDDGSKKTTLEASLSMSF